MNISPGLPAETKKRLELFAGRLRAARKARGWTQERLATVASIGISTVRAIEHGEPTTAIGSYLAVLWALDLDGGIDQLIPADLAAANIGSTPIDTNF
ncbi:helix-turn-helix domain-containing protein [Achromobacter insolitus]|uniref:helix-turn-helix domain-containing protein n=2 Tax=Alcaligenaceae TaxID=506 RepID=UPI000536598D|nr:helix-turn-helix domain-containing protein [Achromobacter insolitus]